MQVLHLSITRYLQLHVKESESIIFASFKPNQLKLVWSCNWIITTKNVSNLRIYADDLSFSLIAAKCVQRADMQLGLCFNNWRLDLISQFMQQCFYLLTNSGKTTTFNPVINLIDS